jgi:betaine-aldehyde dehydrogenase
VTITSAPSTLSATTPPIVELTDPLTGHTRHSRTYVPARHEQIQAALQSAHVAAPSWAAHTHRDRSILLDMLADALQQENACLVEAEAEDRGIGRMQAWEEVSLAIDVLRFYAGAARIPTPVPPAGRYLPHHTSYVSTRPLGVVAAIVPWNYPLLMAVWRIAPVLATGNVVILKPAEQTPHSAILLAAIALPILTEGVLATVPGDRETGRLLASSQLLDGCAFTGSRGAGIKVARAVAPSPVNLELGGNCPAIFTDSAPQDSERRLLTAAIHNGGQSCAAPSRLVTTSTAATERLFATLSDLPAPTPLISREALERTRRRVTEAHESGAVLDWRDGPPTSTLGWHHQAAIARIRPFSPVSLRQRETFAPVVTIEQVSDLSAALDCALDPECGNDLAASVWTTDLDDAARLTDELSRFVGEVWVNDHLVQTPELPHSSASGIDLSTAAMAWCSRPTTVTTRRTSQP